MLLGQNSLEEIGAFTTYEESFIDVESGERHHGLNIISYLGKASSFMANALHFRAREARASPQRK